MKNRVISTISIATILLGAFASIQPIVHATPSGKYFDHLVVIMLENQNIIDVYNQANAPYLYSLASGYSLSTERTAIDHPSEPNYLALGSGLTGDCSNPYSSLGGDGCMTGASGTHTQCDSTTCSSGSDCTPSSTGTCFLHMKSNLIDLLGNASVTYSFYLEGETDQTCDTNFTTAYHAWPLFFNDFVAYPSKCNHAHSFSTETPTNLVSELNGTGAASLIWINPDNCHNMHGISSCTNGCTGGSTYLKCISDGDGYMNTLVQDILTTKTFEKSRAAVLLTFDEGRTSNYPSDYVYTVFAGPVAKTAYSSATFYTSYSILRTIEDNWQMASLQPTDSDASIMSEFFTSDGNFGSCNSLPNGWNCGNLHTQGGTGLAQIEGNSGFHSVLANVGGSPTALANATTQRGVFPWSPCQAPASGVLGNTTGRVSALFDPLSMPANGRFHIFLGLYYWLDRAVTVHGFTYQCLATQVRVEWKNGAFTPPTNSTDFSSTYNRGNSFGWNQTVGAATLGNEGVLTADINSQCKQDEIAWSISTTVSCQLSGIEVGVEGFSFSGSLDVLWDAQIITTVCHYAKGDVDENGVINISDISAIALYYKSEVGSTVYTSAMRRNVIDNDVLSDTYNPDISVVDGSVGIDDLAQAAGYFGGHCT